jgi:hypothetical protein
MGTNKYPMAVEVVQSYRTVDGSLIESKRYKTLVSSENPEIEFNTVSKGYKVAQHDEVVTIVEKALTDLKLKNEGEPIVLNDGARIHVVKRFPEIGMDVEGEHFNLTITFDNSYDSTTGLRIEVGAYSIDTNTQFFVTERFAKHYHKHTKGLMVETLEKAVDNGAKAFQEGVKRDFEAMVASPLDADKLNVKLNDLMESDDSNIPQKYLAEIRKAVISGKPTSQWKAYKMAMEVMGTFDLSVERRRMLSHSLIRVIKSVK